MARVQVRSWRETYRGLMPGHVLDDPGLPAVRERFWSAAVTRERYRIAVYERDGELVGVAMAGPPEEPDPRWAVQLYILYVLAAHHGSGAGAALLDAVVGPAEPAVLWVADPNPRAQAFYRRHGFTTDGTSAVIDGGVPTVRMVRVQGA